MTAETAPILSAAPGPIGPRTAIEARSITKSFGDVLANDSVDFSAFAGEVHALLGENGAGKSTLVKILYGYTRPDDGEILIDGHEVELSSPADARRLGVGMVFQQSTLIPAFTVAENIALVLPDLRPVVDLESIAARVTEMSARYGLQVDPWRRAGHLSVGEQQRVEVVKLLAAGARVLVFDEPTSLLTAHEVESLFEVFASLRADGFPIVFITHKLREVMEIADRITVMRRGRVTGTLLRAQTSEQELVELMFGQNPVRTSAPRPARPGKEAPLLELEGVSTFPTEGVPLEGVTLTIRPGEIVGIAGVSGNGQRELGNAVLGIQRLKSGTRTLFGRDATTWSIGRIRDASVGFLPENPLGTSLIAGMTVEENMALSAPSKFDVLHGLSMNWRAVDRALESAFEQLGLEPLPPRMIVGTLSGGNAQRFAFVRELSRHPRLLVAAYPTKGLDVPTVAAVQRLLLCARDAGSGLLLISHDLGELTALSDRLLVMRGGRFVAEVDPDDADVYEIGLIMTGGEVDDGSRAGSSE
jgi:simple sugar transport system ATP-binding protein